MNDTTNELAQLRLAFWRAQTDCLAAYTAKDDSALAAAVVRKLAIVARQKALRAARVAALPIVPRPTINVY